MKSIVLSLLLVFATLATLSSTQASSSSSSSSSTTPPPPTYSSSSQPPPSPSSSLSSFTPQPPSSSLSSSTPQPPSSSSSSRLTSQSYSSDSSSSSQTPPPPSSSSDSCADVLDCLSESDDCAYDDFTESCNRFDANSSCCPFHYYCVDSQCVQDTEERVCNTTADCLPNERDSGLIDCINGVCLPLGNAGDKCDDDHPCYFGNCNDGKCSAAQVGESCRQPVGGTSGSQWMKKGITCAFGAFCNSSSLCQPLLSEGDDCNVVNDICGTNLICDAVSTKCIALFSIGENEACNENQGPLVCDVGMQCKNGSCKSADEPKIKDCSTDEDCDDGYSCICDAFTGDQYCEYESEYICQKEVKDMYACFKDEKCVAGYFSWSGKSCQKSKCGDEEEEYYSCILCDFSSELFDNCYSKSDTDEFCPSLEAWEKLVILAVIIVVVIVVIIIIFVCCCCNKRQRQGYNDLEDKTGGS